MYSDHSNDLVVADDLQQLFAHRENRKALALLLDGLGPRELALDLKNKDNKKIQKKKVIKKPMRVSACQCVSQDVCNTGA